jgi:hypothetical protein
LRHLQLSPGALKDRHTKKQERAKQLFHGRRAFRT